MTAKANRLIRTMRSIKSLIPAILAALVLSVGLGATVFATKAIDDGIEAQAKFQFNAEVSSVKLALQTHLDQLVTLMQAVRAGFAASAHLNRDEFNLLVETLELRTRYPSVASMSYVARVPARDLPFFIATRGEELPRYAFRYSKEPSAQDRKSVV